MSKLRKQTTLSRHLKKITLILLVSAVLFYLLSVDAIRRIAMEAAGQIIVQVVKSESNGFYSVSYDKIDIDILRSRLHFTNFRMIADSTSSREFEAGLSPRENMYITHIPMLSLTVTSLFDLCFKRVLHVGEVEFFEPEIQWFKNPRQEVKLTLTLEAGDFYQLITNYLNHFKISNFKITNGRFTYMSGTRNFQEKYLIGPVNMSVVNFEVGQELTAKNRFFNTEKLFVQLSGQSILLADSVHEVKFDDLTLSTETSDITLTNLKLRPRAEKLPLPDEMSSYDVVIPVFRLTGIDFVKAYHNNTLHIEDILFQHPAIRIKETGREKKQTNKQAKKAPIIQWVASLFGVVEVRNFELDQAFLDLTMGGGNSSNDRLTVQNASMNLRNVRVDSTTYLFDMSKRPFEHIDFAVNEYAYLMPDSIHHLYIKKFQFSTHDSLIRGDSLVIAPVQGTNRQNRRGKVAAEKQCYIPWFQLSGVGIWNAWKSRTLAMKNMEVSRSEFLFKNQGNAKGTSPLDALADLYPAIGSVIHSISIDSLRIAGSSVQVEEPGRVQFSTPDLRLLASALLIDSLAHPGSGVFFRANDLAISMSQSAFFLPDSSHFVETGMLMLNPAKGFYQADNLHITSYGTSASQVQGTVEQLQLTGFYLQNFLTTGIYQAHSVSVTSPNLVIRLAPGKKEPDKAMLHHMHIGQLQVQNGNLSFNLNDTAQLAFGGATFTLSYPSHTANPRLREADGLEAGIGTFAITHRGTEILRAGNISTSTTGKTFSASNINISRLGQGNIRKLKTPLIHLEGVEIISALRGEYLQWEKATLGPLEIDLVPEKPVKSGEWDYALEKVKKQLQGSFRFVKGGSLQVPVQLLQFTANGEPRQIRGLNLRARHIYFDHSTSGSEAWLGADVTIESGRQNLSWMAGLDTLTFDRLNLSTKAGTIETLGLKVASPPSNQVAISISAPELKATGLNWKKLLQGQGLEAESLQAVIGRLTINNQSKEEPFKINNTLSGPVKPWEKVKIGSLKLAGNNLTYSNESKNRSLHAPLFDMALSGFILPGGGKNPDGRFMFSDSLRVTLQNISYPLPHSPFSLHIGSVTLSSTEPQVTITSPWLVSNHKMHEHGIKMGHQATWMQIEGRQIEVFRPDLQGLLSGEAIKAGKVVADGFMMRFFRDKRLPLAKNRGVGLPHLALLQAGLPIRIDSVILKRSKIDYVEFAEKGNSPGSLVMSQLNAIGTNVTNLPGSIKKDPEMKLHTEVMMLDEAPLKADFTFDMSNLAGRHYVTGSIGPCNLSRANTILEPGTFVHIKRGQLSKASFSFEADTSVAYGSMEFLYSDLKVSVLNKKLEKQGSGKALETFFANTFIVQADNPALFNTRQGNIFAKRDTTRSIINYWTRAFLSGIVSSIGAKNNKDKIRHWQHEVDRKNTTQEAVSNGKQ